MNTEIETEEMNEDEEELSFSELYSSVLLNNEIVITIPPEQVERVKTGLKNLKAKQSYRMKEEGLIPDPSVFTFTERECTEEKYREHYIDLVIELSRRSTVKIKSIRIPDQDF